MRNGPPFEPFDLEEALSDYEIAKYQPDDMIHHNVIYELIRLPMPDPRGAFEDGEEIRRTAVPRRIELISAILQRYNQCLVSVPGRGYRILPPKEQVQYAMKKSREKLNRELNKAALRVTHVNRFELSIAEKQEQLDAQARLAAQRQMIKKDRRGW